MTTPVPALSDPAAEREYHIWIWETLMDWDDAKKQALKILGKDGKITDDKAMNKVMESVGKAFEAFSKSRDDLESKITELQGQCEKLSSSADQLEAKVEKDSLGLDPKKPDDAKKIKQAQDILTASLGEIGKAQDTNLKTLKEAARHLILLSKYNPG